MRESCLYFESHGGQFRAPLDAVTPARAREVVLFAIEGLERDFSSPARYCAVQPPSITSSLPVTNEDSSEAR